MARWHPLGHPVDDVLSIELIQSWADPNIDLDAYAEDVAYIDELKSDIQRKGFLNPIVVKVGPTMAAMIVDGHHRLLAALQLGLTELPVFYQVSGPPGWRPDFSDATASLKRKLMR